MVSVRLLFELVKEFSSSEFGRLGDLIGVGRYFAVMMFRGGRLLSEEWSARHPLAFDHSDIAIHDSGEFELMSARQTSPILTDIRQSHASQRIEFAQGRFRVGLLLTNLTCQKLIDSMTHILVIEDHPKLLESVVRTLQESGFDATGVLTLGEATKVLSPAMGLVVLDLMLPDGSGLEWLAGLRKADNRVPVLILTARDTIKDRVAGLDVGADDYLVKPFALDELLARIRALLRRDANPSTTALTVGELTVDFLSRTAMRDSRPLELQNRQFELLVYLMRHANEVVTREMIASEVWREPTATWTNVIDVHINQLRKKLEGSGRPALLHTIRGKGYVLGDVP